MYADLYHDGNRIDAEIALGASILERIGETKQKRLAPKSVYLGYDVDSLEQSVVSADQPTLPRFSITDASWMRARIAMQSISGSDYSGFVSLLLSFLLIFIGGCGQTFFLEYMIYVEPHAGQTITFFQFLAIALAGVSKFVDRDPKESILRFWKKFHLVKRKIAFKYHALLVFLSWMGAYTSAKAYNFNISVSLHMVFKSGILLINMLLGACILHKRYNHKQVLSVLLVTFGVLMTTAASLPSSQKSASGESDILNWFVGLSILIVSLVTTGFLGIFQDMAYDKFGKHWEEVLFYVVR